MMVGGSASLPLRCFFDLIFGSTVPTADHDGAGRHGDRFPVEFRATLFALQILQGDVTRKVDLHAVDVGVRNGPHLRHPTEDDGGDDAHDADGQPEGKVVLAGRNDQHQTGQGENDHQAECQEFHSCSSPRKGVVDGRPWCRE